jgi:hypothetical protein
VHCRFEIFRKPSISADPGEEALNHPSTRQNDEADLAGDLPHDLDDDVRVRPQNPSLHPEERRARARVARETKQGLS